MQCRSVGRPRFTPLSIVAMVIGFATFWPLGLIVLAYVLWGERLGWTSRVGAFVDGVRSGIQSGRFGPATGFRAPPFGSGNAAFDAYRARELERLEAERRRLEEEARAFDAYMASLRQARDQDEFERFKAARAKRHPDGTV